MKTLLFSPEALEEACEVLENGGVIAHATETCYGLACDLSNPDAVKKLFAIKQRPEGQPVSGLFVSVNDAKRYVVWNERAGELAGHLPGPLTLILPMRSDAPRKLYPTLESYENEKLQVTSEHVDRILETQNSKLKANPTLGVRVSSHPHAQALAAQFGSPLSTTSANLHGKPNPYSAQDIETQFAEASITPDLILDSGILPATPPSTVVDCTSDDLQTRRSGDVRI